MAIIDLFSERLERQNGEISVTYTYDKIPPALRSQIVKIIVDAIGENGYHGEDKKAYEYIRETLQGYYGYVYLGRIYFRSDMEKVLNMLLISDNVVETIDIVEFIFKYIGTIIKNDFQQYSKYTTVRITPDEAIIKLNNRFIEHGIGYSFEGEMIVRIDSIYLHEEITKPTLSLLENEIFKAASKEYQDAQKYYRLGFHKTCLVKCLSAFESTMNVIFLEKSWTFKKTDKASKLIQICFRNGLVPTYKQNQITSLQNLLEQGFIMIENNSEDLTQVRINMIRYREMAHYGLNLTGTTIIFLIEQSSLKL